MTAGDRLSTINNQSYADNQHRSQDVIRQGQTLSFHSLLYPCEPCGSANQVSMKHRISCRIPPEGPPVLSASYDRWTCDQPASCPLPCHVFPAMPTNSPSRTISQSQLSTSSCFLPWYFFSPSWFYGSAYVLLHTVLLSLHVRGSKEMRSQGGPQEVKSPHRGMRL